LTSFYEEAHLNVLLHSDVDTLLKIILSDISFSSVFFVIGSVHNEVEEGSRHQNVAPKSFNIFTKFTSFTP